ncbi:MAG: hypothetical protein ACYTEX_26985 [Planctomycetota bacterium]
MLYGQETGTPDVMPISLMIIRHLIIRGMSALGDPWTEQQRQEIQ